MEVSNIHEQEVGVLDKYIFGDIRFSAEQQAVEESSSSNKCKATLKRFRVTNTLTGEIKTFIKGKGDPQRSRIRNKVKAFVDYSMDKKNGHKGIFHWVFGTDREMDDWEEFSGWAQELGRIFRSQYVQVIEVGEKGNKLHIHLLCNEWYDVEELRPMWWEITGIKGAHVNARKGDIGASGYLSKYLTKDKNMRRGRRMFRTNKGLEKEIENYFEEKKGEVWVCLE